MEHFINHFQEYLIIGLLGALFFKETITYYIQTLLGMEKEEDTPQWAQDTNMEMARLSEYTNHTTTAKLDTLISMHTRHLEMEEREHEKFDQLSINLTNMGRDIKEIKEYGIKLRQ
jgi:hypothetical protein